MRLERCTNFKHTRPKIKLQPTILRDSTRPRVDTPHTSGRRSVTGGYGRGEMIFLKIIYLIRRIEEKRQFCEIMIKIVGIINDESRTVR